MGRIKSGEPVFRPAPLSIDRKSCAFWGEWIVGRRRPESVFLRRFRARGNFPQEQGCKNRSIDGLHTGNQSGGMRCDALQSPDEDSVRKRRKRDPENCEQEKISRIRRGGSGKQAYRKQHHGGCCLFIKRDDSGRISPAHMHAIEYGQYRVRHSRDNSPEDALEIGVVRAQRRRDQQNACQRDKGVDGIARPERFRKTGAPKTW